MVESEAVVVGLVEPQKSKKVKQKKKKKRSLVDIHKKYYFL